MKVAGIDEAGKGPVIGPMVVCGVKADEKDFEKLRKIGVKDSKKLSKSRREKLFRIIKNTCEVEVIVIEASELNEMMKSSSINDILFNSYAKLILNLKPDIAYVDSCDVNSKRLSEKLTEKTNIETISMHKADSIRTEVATASIVAKVLRDRRIEEIKKEIGDFGSGYPSDPKTISFLKKYYEEYGEFPPHVRVFWKTLKRIKNISLL